MRYVKNNENNQLKSMFNRKCNCCKIDIPIYRSSSNENVVFYDGSFYHKECFEDMSSIIKKCKCCGRDIILHSSDEDVVFYDNGYYHTDCFVNKCQTTKTKKWINAYKYIDKYSDIAKEKLDLQFERKKIKTTEIYKCREEADKKIRSWFQESDVNLFIIDNYNLQQLPPNFYVRYLKPLYDGTYFKAPGVKIPPCDLLDMWQQKMNMLIKVRQKNLNNGKSMSSEHMIAYDLTVLINKYNAYLEWKIKQRILEADNSQQHSRIGSLDTSIIQEVSQNNTNKSEEKEMSNLVDDIFN